MSKEKSLESCISDLKKVSSGKDLIPVYGLAHILHRTDDFPAEAVSLCYATGIVLYQISLIGFGLYQYVISS